jgi:phosphatidylglycerophosphatase A
MNSFNMKNPVHILAAGFGSGLSPFAPGTMGTLVAIPIYLLIAGLPLLAYLAICLVTFVMGIWLCDKTSKDLGVHDHGGIVWDEIVGYLVTMAGAPFGWQWILAGFILFRIFDILKPWPIRWLDKSVSGGFGIMLDDLVAGLFSAAILQLAYHFLL